MSLSSGLLWSMFHSKLTLTLALFAVGRNGTAETHSAIRWPLSPSTAFEQIILDSVHKYVGRLSETIFNRFIRYFSYVRTETCAPVKWVDKRSHYVLLHRPIVLNQHNPDKFDIHWVVYRNIISIVKRTLCTSVSNLFYFGITLHDSDDLSPSIISSSRLYIQLSNRYFCLLASKQTAVSVWHMPVAVCTVLYSWWWTEIPPETCRLLFQNKINFVHWCM
jgi:hypothetical protein